MPNCKWLHFLFIRLLKDALCGKTRAFVDAKIGKDYSCNYGSALIYYKTIAFCIQAIYQSISFAAAHMERV